MTKDEFNNLEIGQEIRKIGSARNATYIWVNGSRPIANFELRNPEDWEIVRPAYSIPKSLDFCKFLESHGFSVTESHNGGHLHIAGNGKLYNYYTKTERFRDASVLDAPYQQGKGLLLMSLQIC